jgi:hypothetical protein
MPRFGSFRTEIAKNLSQQTHEQRAMIGLDIRAILVGYGYGKDTAKHLADRMIEMLR